LAGLPAYLELAHVMGLGQTISRDLQARHGDQRWTDEQTVKSLVLVNLTGGDCVEDLVVPEEGKVSRWYRERCGKGDEAHSIMKEDHTLLPLGKYTVNSAED
jgi:hypothetical protein